jgi:uncharacterized membrane protein
MNIKNYIFIAVISVLLIVLVFQQSRLSGVVKAKQEQIDRISKTNRALEDNAEIKFKEISVLKKQISSIENTRKEVIKEKIKIKIQYENKINNVDLMSAWQLDNFFTERLPKDY